MNTPDDDNGCNRDIDYSDWREVLRQKKIEERLMQQQARHTFRDAALEFLHRYLWSWAVTAVLLAAIASFFTSCTTVEQTGTCDTCIGPYDMMLSSHREALERSVYTATP
jgi:hypothetical protein